MKVRITHQAFTFEFPAKLEPEWKSKVERWYQLDAAAYGLAEAYWQWRMTLKNRPDFLIMASPSASNVTDLSFAQTGASSPQKFVHTLPNIRAASLCQVMEWAGPLLCLQNGEQTIFSALREAADLVSSELKVVWVMSVVDSEIHWFELSHATNDQTAFNLDEIGKNSEVGLAGAPTDLYVISWLKKKRTEAR